VEKEEEEKLEFDPNVLREFVNFKVLKKKKKVEIYKGPHEAIVVLYDTSGSMTTELSEKDDIPRFCAVNAFFNAFADKTVVFTKTRVHLVKLYFFGENITEKLDFTDDFEAFKKQIDEFSSEGATRLFDCMGIAIDDLIKIKEKYPKIILRMIALTDGGDSNH